MKKVIYPEQICHRKLPVNFREEDLQLFKGDLKHINKEKSMLIIKDIDYLKDVLFQKNSFTFFDKYCFTHKKSYFKLLSRLIYYFHKNEVIDDAIWVVDNWSKEYFHWFTDVLPRILISEEYHKTHIIVLPYFYKKYSYITDSLGLLDIEYTFFEARNVHFKNLVLTPHTAITGNYDVNIINQLRDKFIDSSQKPSRYIYISRQKANRRKVSNEAEVSALLTKYGFEIHFFEDYSLEQQIEIMQMTKVLISIHGAGLTNMLFMPKGTTILELRNETESQLNCFFALASELDHHYYYITNKGSSTVTHTADIAVDINKLETELQEILD